MAQQNKQLKDIVNDLCCSFDQQQQWYQRLWEITKKATGTLAMSRGDFSALMSVMEEKENLLTQINDSRTKANADITLWQEQKEQAPQEVVDTLNRRLDSMQEVIQRFLKAEKQLEKQISFYQKG